MFLISWRASYSLSFALAESKVKAHIFYLLLIHTAAISQVGRVSPLPVLSWTGRGHRETAITEACQNSAGHLEGAGDGPLMLRPLQAPRLLSAEKTEMECGNTRRPLSKECFQIHA